MIRANHSRTIPCAFSTKATPALVHLAVLGCALVLSGMQCVCCIRYPSNGADQLLQNCEITRSKLVVGFWLVFLHCVFHRQLTVSCRTKHRAAAHYTADYAQTIISSTDTLRRSELCSAPAQKQRAVRMTSSLQRCTVASRQCQIRILHIRIDRGITYCATLSVAEPSGARQSADWGAPARALTSK